jgi:hypothetical protein
MLYLGVSKTTTYGKRGEVIKMKRHLSIKGDTGVKKIGLIFSGILVLFLILASSTASAAPFAYVTNWGSGTVSL